MHRLFLIPAALAAGSACTFDATGLTVPSQQPSGFSDESDSTATVPTTEKQSIVDRFPEFFGLQPPPINFVNVGGDVLVKDIVGLIFDGPAHPIVYDEQGEARPGLFVWTNFMSSGENGGDCEDWTGVEGAARVGHDGFMPDVGPAAEAWHEGRKWTDVGVDLLCDNPSAHLYCVQVTD